MKYQPMTDFDRAWIFRHKDLPVEEGDLAQIRPLSESVANQIWNQYLSPDTAHPSLFSFKDWPNRNGVWHEKGAWQESWESEQNDLPEALRDYLDWDGNTLVYFFYDCDRVIETRWDVFTRCWKNFLFFDDGPLLMGKKRDQVVQFHQDGSYSLGTRPEN